MVSSSHTISVLHATRRSRASESLQLAGRVAAYAVSVLIWSQVEERREESVGQRLSTPIRRNMKGWMDIWNRGF